MPTADYLRTPYVRVWLQLADDQPAIWGSDHLLAWWLRLLMYAQRTYPAAAPIPRGLDGDTETELAELGIIELVSGDLYRFHGLDELRAAELPRGHAGGSARARGGIRDQLGRWLPGAGDSLADDAGTSNELDAGGSLATLSSRAGESTGDAMANTAGQVAGKVAGSNRSTSGAGDQQASDLELELELDKPTLSKGSVLASTSSVSPTTRAPAHTRTNGAAVVPPRNAPPIDPNAIECDEYQAHRGDHRWFPGIGWKCTVCERKRADADLTFSEKVARASERAEHDPGF
jgi:hypothetical protein